MLEACIIIATMIGVVDNNRSNEITVYEADCGEHSRYFIVDSTVNEFKTINVEIIGINDDLTYNIKLKD